MITLSMQRGVIYSEYGDQIISLPRNLKLYTNSRCDAHWVVMNELEVTSMILIFDQLIKEI